MSSIQGIQLNCRSINTKLVETKLLIYQSKPDFVALCETWITSNTKYVPRFEGYIPEWQHRPAGVGGGLCLLVKRGIQYTKLDLNKYTGGVLEVQAIQLYQENSQPISILNIYNPNQNLIEIELVHYQTTREQIFNSWRL